MLPIFKNPNLTELKSPLISSFASSSIPNSVPVSKYKLSGIGEPLTFFKNKSNAMKLLNSLDILSFAGVVVTKPFSFVLFLYLTPEVVHI